MSLALPTQRPTDSRTSTTSSGVPNRPGRPMRAIAIASRPGRGPRIGQEERLAQLAAEGPSLGVLG